MSVERYKTIPNEGEGRFDLAARRPDITPACWLRKKSGSTDVFGRLWWDKPAFTIRTEFYKPEKGRYLHPSEHRPITVREAARCMTLPDDFVLPEDQSMTSIAKQSRKRRAAAAGTTARRIARCPFGSRGRWRRAARLSPRPLSGAGASASSPAASWSRECGRSGRA